MKKSLQLLLLFTILSLIGCGKKETTITNLAELAGGKTFAVPTGSVADQFVLKRFPDEWEAILVESRASNTA